MGDVVHQKRFAGLSELETYWNHLRGGRLVPLRSELDPRGLENLLNGAFVLERVAPRVARMRVAGSLLNELMGLEVRGMPMTTLTTADSRELLADAVEQVFDGPKSAFIEMKADTGIGRPPLEAQMLILPLRSDMGEVSRAIGYLAIRGSVGRAPRRFELTASPLMRALRGHEPIAEVTGGIETVETPMAEDVPAKIRARVPMSSVKVPGPKPYLRLVHSAD